MANFKATLDVLDASGNPETLVCEIEIEIKDSQDIKLEFVSLADGGPILRPSKPRI